MTNKFTPDQVVNLAKNQTGRAIHPFTCANRGDGQHRVAFGDLGALVPTVRGWICPFCDYTQDWAHGFTANEAIEPAFPMQDASDTGPVSIVTRKEAQNEK